MKICFGRSIEDPAYPSMYNCFLDFFRTANGKRCDRMRLSGLYAVAQIVHCANVMYKSCNDFNNLDSSKVEFYDTLQKTFLGFVSRSLSIHIKSSKKY
jgi:hypothetical protein